MALSRDINNLLLWSISRIPGHGWQHQTETRSIFSFHGCLTGCKNQMQSLNSLLRNFNLKNSPIWLEGSILGYKWTRIRICQMGGLLWKTNNNMIFRGKINDNLFEKWVKRSTFLGHFGSFLPNYEQLYFFSKN